MNLSCHTMKFHNSHHTNVYVMLDPKFKRKFVQKHCSLFMSSTSVRLVNSISLAMYGCLV